MDFEEFFWKRYKVFYFVDPNQNKISNLDSLWYTASYYTRSDYTTTIGVRLLEIYQTSVVGSLS